MHTREDLEQWYLELVHEAATRTFCRPEHFAGFDIRSKRYTDACWEAGFDPRDIHDGIRGKLVRLPAGTRAVPRQQLTVKSCKSI